MEDCRSDKKKQNNASNNLMNGDAGSTFVGGGRGAIITHPPI